MSRDNADVTHQVLSEITVKAEVIIDNHDHGHTVRMTVAEFLDEVSQCLDEVPSCFTGKVNPWLQLLNVQVPFHNRTFYIEQ